MDIVRQDATDPAVIRACHKVATAADTADDPFAAPLTLHRMSGWLAHPVEPTELWAVEGATAGGMAGGYLLRLPDPENLDKGSLTPAVRPAAEAASAARCCGTRRCERPATGGRCCGARRSRARPGRRSPRASAPRPAWLTPGGCWRSARSRPGTSRPCASRPPARRPATRSCPGRAGRP